MTDHRARPPARLAKLLTGQLSFCPLLGSVPVPLSPNLVHLLYLQRYLSLWPPEFAVSTLNHCFMLPPHCGGSLSATTLYQEELSVMGRPLGWQTHSSHLTQQSHDSAFSVKAGLLKPPCLRRLTRPAKAKRPTGHSELAIPPSITRPTAQPSPFS